jgi:hypothetical protein
MSGPPYRRSVTRRHAERNDRFGRGVEGPSLPDIGIGSLSSLKGLRSSSPAHPPLKRRAKLLRLAARDLVRWSAKANATPTLVSLLENVG